MTTLAAVEHLRTQLQACGSDHLAILGHLALAVRDSRSGPNADPVDRAIAALYALMLGEVSDAASAARAIDREARRIATRNGL